VAAVGSAAAGADQWAPRLIVGIPPEALVAAVAAEADDDPVGRVLDREDV
jgi:hypothetical protein